MTRLLVLAILVTGCQPLRPYRSPAQTTPPQNAYNRRAMPSTDTPAADPLCSQDCRAERRDCVDTTVGLCRRNLERCLDQC